VAAGRVLLKAIVVVMVNPVIEPQPGRPAFLAPRQRGERIALWMPFRRQPAL
jgi:hypothetical protein